MTKADPTKKRTPLEISFNKCSLNSKCYIVFRPANNSYCITILQNYTKNCCQFVVNSDLMCQKPLILLGFLVERLHCREYYRQQFIALQITSFPLYCLVSRTSYSFVLIRRKNKIVVKLLSLQLVCCQDLH